MTEHTCRIEGIRNADSFLHEGLDIVKRGHLLVGKLCREFLNERIP
ncbi:MAG: hypothetical protein PHW58_07950 [Candidatus Methanofastidiosa archaeon]|nr:hypothetical protein [Candidatus Methanofastidiosa archaeon]